MSVVARRARLIGSLSPLWLIASAVASESAVPTWVFLQPRAVEADPVSLDAALRRLEVQSPGAIGR